MQLTPETYLASRIVAQVLQAEPYRCWRNALLTVLSRLVTCYIEGWVVLPRRRGIDILEHGWSCHEQIILDPSLVLVEAASQSAFYFPGLQLERDDLLALLPGTVLPLVAHTEYGADGMGHQGYKQAYEGAWELARRQANERNLPLDTIAVFGRKPQVEWTLALADG